MRILSAYFGHDSSVCLLEDGRPVAVVEKERATRVRHDHGWMDLESVLDEHGWEPGSVDLVAINPYVRNQGIGPARVWELTGHLYTDRSDFQQPHLRCPPEHRFSQHDISLFGRTYPGVAIDHHLGHIATGFYTSPFERATVLSADGGGDGRTCAAARAEGSTIVDIEYGWGLRHSDRELNIGSLWGSVGQHYLGYGRLDGAGKVMGLAACGTARPDLVAALREAALMDPYSPLPGSVVAPRVVEDVDPTAQDLAASVQAFTTDAYLAAAERLAGLYGDDRLVLTGGCSMNCVANTAVHQRGLFGETFVPAQPSDCGLALGQALFAWHHVLKQPRVPRVWSAHLGFDAGPTPRPELVAAAVEHLLAGRTVGVCAGRAENGPRALGQRSILGDPRLPDIAGRINSTVKHREWYRPFGPMVLEEDYDAHFDVRVPSPYMSYVTNVLGDGLPGVTHFDRSTRPQVVAADNAGLARVVLLEWKRRTGLGVLLNTSLNSKEPIVDTVEQAIATWQRTGLDVLVTPTEVHIA